MASVAPGAPKTFPRCGETSSKLSGERQSELGKLSRTTQIPVDREGLGERRETAAARISRTETKPAITNWDVTDRLQTEKAEFYKQIIYSKY